VTTLDDLSYILFFAISM